MDLLCVDGQKRIVASLGSDAEPDLSELSYGEVCPIRVAKVRRAPVGGQNLWEPVDISTSALRVGLGPVLTAPTGGAFTLNFGASSSTLVYNFGLIALNLALSSMSDFGDAGGGFATQDASGLYRITFNTVGARSLFTASSLSGLSPQSTAEIRRIQTGDGSTQEIQSLRLVQLPAVSTSTFSASSATAATVTVIDVGGTGVNAKVSIALNPKPTGGYWTITVTGGTTDTTEFLAYDISPDDLRAALGRITSVGVDGDSAPNVHVTQGADGTYYLQFVGALAAEDIGTVTVGVSGLKTTVFMVGSLDLRDIDLERILSSGDATLYLEVEETPSGGTPQKLLRRLVNVVSPVLNVV